jgi:MOSC domain-containing protein YiiM
MFVVLLLFCGLILLLLLFFYFNYSHEKMISTSKCLKNSSQAGTILAVCSRDVKSNPNQFDRILHQDKVSVGIFGLFDSHEWHRSADIPHRDQIDRAILIQSQANLDDLMDYEKLITKQGKSLKSPLYTLKAGSFGENIFLDGIQFASNHICIGDTFTIFRINDHTTPVCVFEVCCPRRPCSNVDTLHGATYRSHGIRAHCARTGLAGYFCRVIVAGSIQAGDTVVITQRPYPEWTIARVSYLLYGHDEAVMKYATRMVTSDEWMGTREELRTLGSLPELASLEWKDNILELIKQLDR